MRCVGLLVGLCLLFAGVGPKRDQLAPCANDELAAVNPLAKLAVRRHENARPHGALQLGAFALLAAQPQREPPRFAIDILHPTPAARWLEAHPTFDARGPPEAEES